MKSERKERREHLEQLTICGVYNNCLYMPWPPYKIAKHGLKQEVRCRVLNQNRQKYLDKLNKI